MGRGVHQEELYPKDWSSLLRGGGEIRHDIFDCGIPKYAWRLAGIGHTSPLPHRSQVNDRAKPARYTIEDERPFVNVL